LPPSLLCDEAQLTESNSSPAWSYYEVHGERVSMEGAAARILTVGKYQHALAWLGLRAICVGRFVPWLVKLYP
jgi:hypothetical protein